MADMMDFMGEAGAGGDPMDFVAGGGAAQYAPPAMGVPDGVAGSPLGGNPIAQAMDAVSFGAMGGPAAGEDPFQGMPVTSTGSMGGMSGGIIPEMTKLREWETQHEEELEESARKEENAKKDTRQKASDELAKWYQDRHAELAKRLEVNRAQEQEMEAGRLAALKPEANPWERVVDLIDTNSRTADEARDTSRMRSLLIQLKSNPVGTAPA